MPDPKATEPDPEFDKLLAAARLFGLARDRRAEAGRLRRILAETEAEAERIEAQAQEMANG